MGMNLFSIDQTVEPKIQIMPEPMAGKDGFGKPQLFRHILAQCMRDIKSGDGKSFRAAVGKFLEQTKNEPSALVKYLPEMFQFDPSGKSGTNPNDYLSGNISSDSSKKGSLVGHLLKPFEKAARGRLDSVQSNYFGIQEILDRLHLYFDVDMAPESFLPWLASWAAFEWVEDPGWEKLDSENHRRWMPVELFVELIKREDEFKVNKDKPDNGKTVILPALQTLFEEYFRNPEAASGTSVAIPREAIDALARWTARGVAIQWGEVWNSNYIKWDEEEFLNSWDEETLARFQALCKKCLEKIKKRFEEFFSKPESSREDALLWLSRAVFAPSEQFIARMSEDDSIDKLIYDLFFPLCNDNEKDSLKIKPSQRIVDAIKRFCAIELTTRWSEFWPRPGDRADNEWTDAIMSRFAALCEVIINELAVKCRLWYESPGRRTGCLTWWLKLFTFTIDPNYKGRKEIPINDLIDSYYAAYPQVFAIDPESQLRQLLSRLLPQYGIRGTRDGFEDLLQVYLGEDWAGLTINELLNPFQIGCDSKGRKLEHTGQTGDEKEIFNFSEEPFASIIGDHRTLKDFVTMGNRGLLRSVIGSSTVIGEGMPYFFRVYIDVARPHKPVLIRRKKKFFQDVIDCEKPAHTTNSLSVTAPPMGVGRHSAIGKDTLIGGLTL